MSETRERRRRARRGLRRGVGWVGSAARLHWVDARAITAAALVTTLPATLIGAGIDRLGQIDAEGRSDTFLVLIATALVVNVLFVVLGSTFLSGVLGNYLQALGAARQDPSPRAIARALAEAGRQVRLWRLVRADLYIALATIAGTLLLIVPGLLAFVYLSLTGPVMSIEHRRPYSAMRRSVALVRRQPIGVATALILPSFVWGIVISPLQATPAEPWVPLVLAGLILSPFTSIVRLQVSRRLLEDERAAADAGRDPGAADAGLSSGA